MTISVAGGCFCGAIRYELTDVPLASMMCHCHSCRRIAGAPVVAWITFAKNNFRLTRGMATDVESSLGVRRAFCSSCGTHLTYENAKCPQEIDVTTCTLDDPNAYPPTHHSWVSHDLQWVHFGDGLPKYAESKSKSTVAEGRSKPSLDGLFGQ
jgi:hypothetical protein